MDFDPMVEIDGGVCLSVRSDGSRSIQIQRSPVVGMFESSECSIAFWPLDLDPTADSDRSGARVGERERLTGGSCWQSERGGARVERAVRAREMVWAEWVSAH